MAGHHSVLLVDHALIDEYACLVGPSAFFVYIVLLRLADKGEDSPSVGEIAIRTRLCRVTVVQSIKKLAACNMIALEDRGPREDGGQQSHRYVILPI